MNKFILFIFCMAVISVTFAQYKPPTQADIRFYPKTGKSSEFVTFTPFELIKAYNEELSKRETFSYFDAEKLTVVMNETGCKFMIAILGLTKNQLIVNLLPSNKDGSDVYEVHPDDYDEIIKSNERLRDALKNGIPLGLDKFPSWIKLTTSEMQKVYELTKGKYFILMNGIHLPGETVKDVIFTIAVVTSEVNGTDINRDHANGAVAGAETWPADQYIYFQTFRNSPPAIRRSTPVKASKHRK